MKILAPACLDEDREELIGSSVAVDVINHRSDELHIEQRLSCLGEYGDIYLIKFI